MKPMKYWLEKWPLNPDEVEYKKGEYEKEQKKFITEIIISSIDECKHIVHENFALFDKKNVETLVRSLTGE